MALKVVGAGLGRTGTHSLKIALESLLGGTCYHMVELFPRPEHIPLWHQAVLGQEPDWDQMLAEFTAVVDWPAAAVWEELHRAYPEAPVILSVRSSTEAWWKSFSDTILQVMQRSAGNESDPWTALSLDMLAKFTPDYGDPEASMAAYEAHNDRVRQIVPADQLIVWQPSDGWGPICRGLGLPEPGEPFPHVNTTDDFRAMVGLND